MRIISANMCEDCSYFIEDCDGSGLCCNNIDEQYKPVEPNQSACEYFCEEIKQYNDIDDYLNQENNDEDYDYNEDNY